MNKIFLFVLSCLFFISCGQNTEVDAQTTNPAKTQTQQEQAPRPRVRSSMAQVTSRPKAEIQKEFPFDISLTDATRKEFNSKDVFKKNGKPTILLFWLTTCVPCHYEMDAIQEKYAQWQEEADFNFYAISTDFSKNYEKFIAQNKKYNWPWEVYHDTNREFRLVMPGELNGLPQTFILDKDGNIIYHRRKYRSGDEDLFFEQIKGLQ